MDRTLHRLSAAARENGVAIQPPVVLTGAPRFQNENLKLVEAQLFCAQETLTSPDCQGITVLEAKDPYEEAEFAAATIRRLVAERATATGKSPSSAGTPPGTTAAWTPP